MNLNRLALRGLPFVGACLLVASTSFAQSCPYDLDENNQVNVTDAVLALSAQPFISETLSGVLASFGPCPEQCPGDLNDSGSVDGEDLGIALAGYDAGDYTFNDIVFILASFGTECNSPEQEAGIQTALAIVEPPTTSTRKKGR